MTQDEPAKPTHAIGTEAMATIISPLAGVNPRSLDALMAEDPAKLSEGEFDQIIAEMRKMRKIWAENESKKDSAEAKAPKAPKPPRGKGTLSIDLDDLLA